MEDRLNSVYLTLFDLKGFGHLPGPGVRRAGGDGFSVRSLERASVAGGMIEENKCERDAMLGIEHDKTAVANSCRCEVWVSCAVPCESMIAASTPNDHAPLK